MLFLQEERITLTYTVRPVIRMLQKLFLILGNNNAFIFMPMEIKKIYAKKRGEGKQFTSLRHSSNWISTQHGIQFWHA